MATGSDHLMHRVLRSQSLGVRIMVLTRLYSWNDMSDVILEGIYIRFSHIAPDNPKGHMHISFPFTIAHDPPFLQRLI